jgi:hypothetical protein
MKRKITMALAVGALIVTMLPGIAAAANGAASADVKECQAAFAEYGFTKVGQCVRHVARGGTLGPEEPPPPPPPPPSGSTFEEVCEDLDGEFREEDLDLDPVCVWDDELTANEFSDAETALDPFCEDGYISGVRSPQSYLGCEYDFGG